MPQDELALPRVIYEHLRGHPFACGPLLGSRGQPVGALGLSRIAAGSHPRRGALGRPAARVPRSPRDRAGACGARHAAGAPQRRARQAQDVIARDARSRRSASWPRRSRTTSTICRGVGLLRAQRGHAIAAGGLDALPRIERAVRSIGELVSRPAAGLAHDVGAELGRYRVSSTRSSTTRRDDQAGPPRARSRSIMDSSRCRPCTATGAAAPDRAQRRAQRQDALLAVPPERRALRVSRAATATTSGCRRRHRPRHLADVLGQLFHPFVTSKGEGHLGLGLAACARIAQAHRRPGSMARTRRMAARCSTSCCARRRMPSRRTKRGSTRPIRRGASILAVDDDPDIVDIVRSSSSRSGSTSSTASGADQAWARRRHVHSIVILATSDCPSAAASMCARRSATRVSRQARTDDRLGHARGRSPTSVWARATAAEEAVPGHGPATRGEFTIRDII